MAPWAVSRPVLAKESLDRAGLSAGETLATIRCWFGVSLKSPLWTLAISRSAALAAVASPAPFSMKTVKWESWFGPCVQPYRSPVSVVEPAGDPELPAEAALDLLADPDQPAVGDRVLEPGMLAVGAVAVVALHGDDRLGDVGD